MALITTVPASINDLATVLAESLRTGQGARKKLGDSDAAFSWSSGLPPTVADYVAVDAVSGLSFDAFIGKPSGTPAGIVAEGAAKPNAVAYETRNVQLVKHAGYAEFSIEQMLRAEALASVVYQVLASQVLSSFENAAMAAVYAGTTTTADGATLIEAILNAQSLVLGAGGRPGLLIISPPDYAALMQGPIGGYAHPATDQASGPVGGFAGMIMHVSAGATTNSPVVADPAGITAAQNESSPVVLADPFSQSSTNKIRLILDLLAAVVVTSPGVVVKTTVTP